MAVNKKFNIWMHLFVQFWGVVADVAIAWIVSLLPPEAREGIQPELVKVFAGIHGAILAYSAARVKVSNAIKKAAPVVVLLLLVPCAASAQLVQNSTPDPARSFEWKQTSDGSSLAVLNAWTLAERYFALPFGLDFYAGHSVWLGTRTRLDRLTDAEGVFGYELYGTKDVGGDGFYIKGSLGFAVGPRSETHSAFSGYLAFGAGYRF